MWFCDEITSAGDDFIYNLCWRPTVESIASFPFISLVWPIRTADGKNSVHFHFLKTTTYFPISRTAEISKYFVDDMNTFWTNHHRRSPCWTMSIVIIGSICISSKHALVVG